MNDMYTTILRLIYDLQKIGILNMLQMNKYNIIMFDVWNLYVYVNGIYV
jgi:hypothetical protein